MKGLITDDNQVVALFTPEKEGLKLPSEATINKLPKDMKAEKLTAYVDKVSDEPLTAEAPKKGKIVPEARDDIFGTTTLTLPNEVKIAIKKIDFKADEVHMKGASLGGSPLFPDLEIISIGGLNAAGAGGLGNFSVIDFEKVFAGKKASVNYNISLTTESVPGSCSPKDFETMMQFTYSTFIAPRRGSDAFTSYKGRNKAALKNQELDPSVIFNDFTQAGIYMNHPRAEHVKADIVDQMDYGKTLSMYQDRSEDASDFTFIFVSNIDIEKTKPVTTEYLGALPAISRQKTFKDDKIEVRQGIYENEFTKKQETLKASVFVLRSGDCGYDLRNSLLLGMTSQILDLAYTEKVREDEGGTYGVYVGGRLQRYPKEKIFLQIIFGTVPNRKEKLMKIIFDEVINVTKTGPSRTSLNRAKKYILKKHTKDLEGSSYWLRGIDGYSYTDVNRVDDYEKIVNSVTVNDIRKPADDLLKQKNGVEVTMVSMEDE